jgi:hypothetical protein
MRDGPELRRRDTPAGQAHAREAAILRSVQRQHTGAMIRPDVSERARTMRSRAADGAASI